MRSGSAEVTVAMVVLLRTPYWEARWASRASGQRDHRNPHEHIHHHQRRFVR